MKWFRVCKYVATDAGERLRFVDRILAASYGHAYEICDRVYGPGSYNVASVPPFTDHTQCGVACNLRPRTFIVGL